MTMTAATNGHQQSLSDARERCRNAREARKRAEDTLAAARAAGDEQVAAEASLALDLARHDVEISDEYEKMVLRRAPANYGNGFGSTSFLHDPHALGQLEEFARGGVPQLQPGSNKGQKLGNLMSAEQAASRLAGTALAATPGMVEPTPNMGRGPFAGLTPAPQPPTSFLDLCPSTPMDGPSYPYARKVKGDRTGGAAPVLPGAVKPQATAEYKDAEAKPTVIAEYIKVSDVTLQDVDQLQGALQADLMNEVRAVVEEQVLIGSGVWPNLPGLMNDPDVIPIPFDAAALAPDLILKGIATLGKGGVSPNVTALSWEDWEALESIKTGADNEYVNSPFLAVANTLWNLPFVPAVGIPPGKALVGDTRTIQVLWAMPIQVFLGQESDDMTRNLITLLAETRVASAVRVPSAWAIVDLAGTGTQTAAAPKSAGAKK